MIYRKILKKKCNEPANIMNIIVINYKLTANIPFMLEINNPKVSIIDNLFRHNHGSLMRCTQ